MALLTLMVKWMRPAARVGVGVGVGLGLFAGCGDDGGPAGSDDTGQDSAVATETGGGSTSNSASDSAPSTSSDSDSTSSPATSSQPTTDPSDTATSESTGQSTGGEELCGLSDDGGDEPWFEVTVHGQPLEANGTLELECGGQGAFMFEFKVALGGFDPGGNVASFGVTMDVEGFNVGPEGHFFHADPYSVFIGCEEPIGGLSQQNYIRMFPPDEIADFEMLDGAAATLSFTLYADGQSIPLEVPMTISAVNENDAWCFCLGDPECF